jgi:hypothetical protein
VKDLRTITARQLSFVWLVGLPLAIGLLAASLLMQRRVVRSMVQPMARREMLAARRAREVDSLFFQYAQEHPDDRSAQAQAVQRHAERVQADRRDSQNRALIHRAQIDTGFDWRAESERSWTLRLSGMIVALALRIVGLLTPIVLLVLTVVWTIPRLRRREPRASA